MCVARQSISANLPNRNFAKQIVLQFQFLHLAISHTSVLAIKEVTLYFVPTASILRPESDLDPVCEVISRV